MVDITAKLFWYRTKEWYENMADKLNDVVYTDDSKETVNVINLILLGWILLGLIVYIIGTIIANQLRKRKAGFLKSETENFESESEPLNQYVSCTNEETKTVFTDVSYSEKPKEPPKIPSCIGEDEEVVEWINKVFEWIYDQRIVSPILDSWLFALNARTRLSSTEHAILVDFKDVQEISGPPNVTDAIEVFNTRGDLIVSCLMDIQDVIFDVTVTQFKGKEKVVSPFIVKVHNFSSKVNIECVPEDLNFIVRNSETPQVQLSAEPTNENSITIEDAQLLNDVVCEICSEAFSSAIVELKLSCYSECPRLTLKPLAQEEVTQNSEKDTEEKLLVKIIKATKLGGTEGCIKPYCVVEMDEPPQKFETTAIEEKHNPFWDESFTFVVKDASAELLFEIYDKEKSSPDNFLGLGIVSVEELLKNPSQRQIIPLQSRPLEEDDVTGSLTAEFLFLNQITPVYEPTHLAQKNLVNNGKSIETSSRVTAGGTVITTTTIKRTKEDGDADLPRTALKELEKQGKSNSTSKSTLIIHSVQKIAKDKSGQWQEVPEAENSISESLEASPASHMSKDSRATYSESIPSSPSHDQNSEERSRPKEKKSILGSIKRRLSFKKSRSKSAENHSESSNYSQGSSRSASTDRIRQTQKPSPIKGKFMGSTRSSLSEVSGISGSSSRTFISEKSTLVIETKENGIIKRYLIPNSLIHQSKWKKRGIKLHIYNDHVFIAKHLSGSTLCQVCQRYLTRRPGKQGYECRGCNLQCHKSCHVKVEAFCSNSSINSMQVEYIQDPNGSTPKSI